MMYSNRMCMNCGNGPLRKMVAGYCLPCHNRAETERKREILKKAGNHAGNT